jgi:hypothetical protein
MLETGKNSRRGSMSEERRRWDQRERRREPQYGLPDPLDQRRGERRAPPIPHAAPVTPADYQRWLTERATLRGLLLEAGEMREKYAEDAMFQSLLATRAKLARIEELIEDYEARGGGRA